MTEVNPSDRTAAELTNEKILAQLELMTCDDVFRSSKRSIAFLNFVVKETLKGSADQIKERTIGAEVFGRPSSYDTNLDHVVRTAATELRKRLTIYYGDDKHRSELRIYMIPGSYIPKFAHPHDEYQGAGETEGSPDCFPARNMENTSPPRHLKNRPVDWPLPSISNCIIDEKSGSGRSS